MNNTLATILTTHWQRAGKSIVNRKNARYFSEINERTEITSQTERLGETYFPLKHESQQPPSLLHNINDLMLDLRASGYHHRVMENPGVKRLTSSWRFCVVTKVRAPRLLMNTVGLVGNINGMTEMTSIIHGSLSSYSSNRVYLNRIYYTPGVSLADRLTNVSRSKFRAPEKHILVDAEQMHEDLRSRTKTHILDIITFLQKADPSCFVVNPGVNRICHPSSSPLPSSLLSSSTSRHVSSKQQFYFVLCASDAHPSVLAFYGDEAEIVATAAQALSKPTLPLSVRESELTLERERARESRTFPKMQRFYSPLVPTVMSFNADKTTTPTIPLVSFGELNRKVDPGSLTPNLKTKTMEPEGFGVHKQVPIIVSSHIFTNLELYTALGTAIASENTGVSHIGFYLNEHTAQIWNSLFLLEQCKHSYDLFHKSPKLPNIIFGIPQK